MDPASGSAVCDYYILFANHHEGLRLQKELAAAGVPCTVAPTPREASSFCGMSLLLKEEYLAAAEEVIKRAAVSIEGIVRLPRKLGGWNGWC